MDVERFVEVVTVNVLFKFDEIGDELIWTQVLKLSEETWKDPEQLVLEVFVVKEFVLITLLKVTEIDLVASTDEAESDGDVDKTLGNSFNISSSLLW